MTCTPTGRGGNSCAPVSQVSIPEVKSEVQRKEEVFEAKSAVSKEPPKRKRLYPIMEVMQSLVLG